MKCSGIACRFVRVCHVKLAASRMSDYLDRVSNPPSKRVPVPISASDNPLAGWLRQYQGLPSLTAPNNKVIRVDSLIASVTNSTS
jgi:hypothetical protein